MNYFKKKTNFFFKAKRAKSNKLKSIQNSEMGGQKETSHTREMPGRTLLAQNSLDAYFDLSDFN